MADKGEDQIHKLVETLEGKHNVLYPNLTPDQQLRAAYVHAILQSCILCGAEGPSYAVGKAKLSSTNVILYALCFECYADPGQHYWAEKKVIETFLDLDGGRA